MRLLENGIGILSISAPFLRIPSLSCGKPMQHTYHTVKVMTSWKAWWRHDQMSSLMSFGKPLHAMYLSYTVKLINEKCDDVKINVVVKKYNWSQVLLHALPVFVVRHPPYLVENSSLLRIHATVQVIRLCCLVTTSWCSSNFRIGQALSRTPTPWWSQVTWSPISWWGYCHATKTRTTAQCGKPWALPYWVWTRWNAGVTYTVVNGVRWCRPCWMAQMVVSSADDPQGLQWGKVD